jgi:hypothetical protein
MRTKQFTRAAALAGVLTLGAAGSALADDSAAIDTTGQGSINMVNITDNTTQNYSNTNSFSVSNVNSQTATSGAVVESGNTTASGEARSGGASNTNTVSTTIGSSSAGTVGGLGGGSGSGGAPGSGDGAGSGSAGGLGGGSGLAVANTGGLGGGSGVTSDAATLPKVGCSAVCDVSALRAAYHPNDNAIAAAAKQSKGLSTALMALAALLSLAGAGGSAIYASRRVKA